MPETVSLTTLMLTQSLIFTFRLESFPSIQRYLAKYNHTVADPAVASGSAKTCLFGLSAFSLALPTFEISDYVKSLGFDEIKRRVDHILANDSDIEEVNELFGTNFGEEIEKTAEEIDEDEDIETDQVSNSDEPQVTNNAYEIASNNAQTTT